MPNHILEITEYDKSSPVRAIYSNEYAHEKISVISKTQPIFESQTSSKRRASPVQSSYEERNYKYRSKN